MDIREEFKKLEEVAARIGFGIYWNEYQQKYQTDLSNLSQTVCYLNGAWHAFKKQQKKIDGIVSIITEAYKSDGNSSVEIVHNEILELLK